MRIWNHAAGMISGNIMGGTRVWYRWDMPPSTIPGKNGTIWVLTTTPDGVRVRHQYPTGDEIDIPSSLDHTMFGSEGEALAAIEAL